MQSNNRIHSDSKKRRSSFLVALLFAAGDAKRWPEKLVTKMSMKLELCPESDYLKVSAMGEFSLEEAARTFLEMLEAVARHKVNKVLFDGRGVAGEPKTMERFYYGEFAAQSIANFAARGVSRATRFAYVLDEPVLDPRRFGETVAVNRGMFIKAFDNLEDALGWLGAAPANKLDAGDGK